MLTLSKHFGNPHRKFKSIHIGGTNGKGSVALKTATGLQFAGYRTGLFTSPHIDSFCERIQVDQELISEDKVVEHAEKIFEAVDKLDVNVTFFDIVTMMAFLEFREE